MKSAVSPVAKTAKATTIDRYGTTSARISPSTSEDIRMKIPTEQDTDGSRNTAIRTFR